VDGVDDDWVVDSLEPGIFNNYNPREGSERGSRGYHCLSLNDVAFPRITQ
jgi:hypothetical protein